MKCDDCQKCGQKVGWIGFYSTLGLGFFKLYVGIISGSRALMASAFCSLTDVVSAVSIIGSNTITRKPRTSKYPYGYGKIEFVVSMVVSLSILLSAFFLFISSFYLIVKKVHIAPLWVAFFAAIISSILSSMKYKYAQCVARELNSPAIQAHADHNKTDSITAILVAVGILFARMGLGFMDPLIAVFETAHVLFATGEVFTRGARGLLDASVPYDKLLKIENASRRIDGVRNVTDLRARQAGQDLFVDICVVLKEDISVAQASFLKRQVSRNIFEFLPETRDVLVRMQT